MIQVKQTNKTTSLTVDQKRCGGNLVATVFVGQRGRLFDRREMFGGGWRVNVTYLYTWWRWGLDVALSWKEEKRSFSVHTGWRLVHYRNKLSLRRQIIPLNRTEATSRSEFTWSWMFLLSSSLRDFTNLEQTFMSKRLGRMNLMPMATFWGLGSSGVGPTDCSVFMALRSGITQIPSMSSATRGQTAVPSTAATVTLSILLSFTRLKRTGKNNEIQRCISELPSLNSTSVKIQELN